jgi:hypothetical protein
VSVCLSSTFQKSWGLYLFEPPLPPRRDLKSKKPFNLRKSGCLLSVFSKKLIFFEVAERCCALELSSPTLWPPWAPVECLCLTDTALLFGYSCGVCVTYGDIHSCCFWFSVLAGEEVETVLVYPQNVCNSRCLLGVAQLSDSIFIGCVDACEHVYESHTCICIPTYYRSYIYIFPYLWVPLSLFNTPKYRGRNDVRSRLLISGRWWAQVAEAAVPGVL